MISLLVARCQRPCISSPGDFGPSGAMIHLTPHHPESAVSHLSSLYVPGKEERSITNASGTLRHHHERRHQHSGVITASKNEVQQQSFFFLHFLRKQTICHINLNLTKTRQYIYISKYLHLR